MTKAEEKPSCPHCAAKDAEIERCHDWLKIRHEALIVAENYISGAIFEAGEDAEKYSHYPALLKMERASIKVFRRDAALVRAALKEGR